MKTVQQYNKAAPGFEHFSFCIGKDNVVMPTSFNRMSAPRFHVLWPDLKRMRAASALAQAEGWRQPAGAINPYPCTQVDENGELRPVLNFGNCTLPVLLHTHAIRSARGVPPEPSEPPTRPGRRTTHRPSRPRPENHLRFPLPERHLRFPRAPSRCQQSHSRPSRCRRSRCSPSPSQ